MAPARSPFDDPPAKRTYPAPLHLRPDAKPVDESKRVSGASALGMGLMNMDDSDSDSDDERPPARTTSHRSPPPPEHPQARTGPIPLAAPRPGYAAPAFDLQRPEPSATPDARSRYADLELPPPAYASAPGTPVSAHGPPSPLPLGAPMTPIQPVFARPAKVERDVKFASGTIMRGQAEDVLLPKRGEKGDDFWRRFSIVAHDEAQKRPNEKTSSWLQKTQNGTSRMSRYVWITAIFFILVIAAAIGFGLYISHNNKTTSVPTALGGSDGHQALSSDIGTTSTKASAAAPSSSSSPHVSPTHTVDRRAPGVLVEATGITVPIAHKQHHRRSHLNRGSELD